MEAPGNEDKGTETNTEHDDDEDDDADGDGGDVVDGRTYNRFKTRSRRGCTMILIM